MEFPKSLDYHLDFWGDSPNGEIIVHSGLTVFLGPNGSGKTQILRSIKNAVQQLVPQGHKARLVSAGRMHQMEMYRSDYDGRRGTPRFDAAEFGDHSQLEHRHQNESAVGDFHSLSVRPDLLLKVQERLRRLFGRELLLEWTGGRLKIFFSKRGTNHSPYSASREASGLLHLVALLAALYDDEVSALLVDEPEVSLHPQLQSFLLSEIAEVAGDPDIAGKKLVFVTTHSTHFIQISKPEDLISIVFCGNPDSPPLQIRPGDPILKSKEIRSFVARLSQDHKIALFAHQPLLVEGPSDRILCEGIANILGCSLSGSGVQLLPVVGKDELKVVAKLFRLVGKKPVIMADADALSDDIAVTQAFANTKSVKKAVNKLGYTSYNKFAQPILSDFYQMVESHWAEIESICSQNVYGKNLPTTNDIEKTKRRAALVTILCEKKSSFTGLQHESDWIALQLRLLALVDFLEENGFHILRRGTIEAYYHYESESEDIGKPEAAAREMVRASKRKKAFSIKQYSDIVRCLLSTVQTDDINEAESLRHLLLSIVPPALNRLSNTTTTQDLQALSRGLIGERSSIFLLSPVVHNGQADSLRVELNTEILSASGFPFELSKSCNPLVEIPRLIGAIEPN